MNSFNYNGYDYYISYENKEFNIYINMYLKNECELPEINYPKNVIIGTKDNNLSVPTKLLYGNSLLFQDLINLNIDLNNNGIIRDEFENIDIYINCLTDNIDYEKIDKLYTISVTMLDINIEIITYKIIENVKNYVSDINVAWKFLELLYNKNIENKFIMLLYIIFKKYERKDFMKKINNINQMNNEIFIELVKDRKII